MRILIYGAGVIGSLYAALLSEGGFNTTLYARGKRLERLKKYGLLYLKNGYVKKANVGIIDKLEASDSYHYIFLTVREEQVHQALQELKMNRSPNIVTMVNTIEHYEEWEKICGKGRILPAFPGAGGSIDDGVLNAELTPRIIQPTTFGEISGKKTEQSRALAQILKICRIPYQIVPNMHNWQISHLGMVVPIADAYYMSNNPVNVYKDKKIMDTTAKRMKDNFRTLSKRGILSPFRFNLFMVCPRPILSFGLKIVFKSDFGDKFMYRHSMKAPEEMRDLHQKFYDYMKMNM